MNEQTFSYLIFGLAKYLDIKARYPLPDELRFALNQLAYVRRDAYPRTITAALQMFHQPLHEWWPETFPAFDQSSPILYDNGLSIAANEYLEELLWQTDLPAGASIEHFQLALDKLTFKKLLNRLRKEALISPKSAQRDYVELRRFLISHPWPTTQEIVNKFSTAEHIGPEDVGEFYTFADVQSNYFYDDHYWNCEQCGPLVSSRGELKSIKPSVCGPDCPRHNGGWQRIEPHRQRRLLKRAHHLSVLIPGVPELQLYEWLINLQANTETVISGIELWPGIDSYDIRILFSDGEAWAVDIKDYTDPSRLAAVVPQSLPTDVPWNRAFYIFPTYRLHQRNRYVETVEMLQQKLLKNVDLMDIDSFQKLVKSRVRRK